MKLSGKVALVVGGARIGSTVAIALASAGCDLILTYRRSRKEALEAANQTRKYGIKTTIVKLDATSERDVSRFVAQMRKRRGKVDFLVHMASIYESGAWTDFGSRTSQRIWDSHVKSAYLLASAAVSLFPKGKGRIVLFSDWVAASGRPRYKNFVHYYTAKYALIGLTQALALELAPRVLVSAIAPGPILPPKNLTNEETRHIEKVTPVGRWGGADEIAKAVLFLLDSNFVTGECIRVDGGRHLL